ncbi:MAG: amidohydrolase [Candidatus Magnetoglobus multicellularis str. Araruama]|uniref:Amidohydrolase n=1 Tax=Candidatus Magnetoglobus multicellularis str. Araruama TaxID=890399 RepID=A0A1V1P733_9BACT|nr:MAG: amidohydrolase [Candidatus Magnetoglobus multicellularis str. Araruama]
MKKQSRRDFIKYSCASAGTLALSGALNGCTTFALLSDTVVPIQELQLPDIHDEKGIYIKNANIVDVKTGKLSNENAITISNGKIEAMGHSTTLKNNDYLEINLNNAYVIPGLIDSHCHITFPCTYGFNIIDMIIYFKQIKRNYNQHIANGITTVRDMGAFSLLLPYFNDQLEKGNHIGPRVIFCNKFTNIYRSHPDIAPPDFTRWAIIDDYTVGDQSIWFRTMAELENGLKWNLERDASFIKITLDDQSLMCGGGKIPIYEQQHLNTIFNFAEHHNLPVAGHVLRKFGFDRAMQWNMHSLEHTIGDAFHSNQEIETMVKKMFQLFPH